MVAAFGLTTASPNERTHQHLESTWDDRPTVAAEVAVIVVAGTTVMAEVPATAAEVAVIEVGRLPDVPQVRTTGVVGQDVITDPDRDPIRRVVIDITLLSVFAS